eukprot:scaffold188491_cov27-Tisochrysis_lutea.AAC.1
MQIPIPSPCLCSHSMASWRFFLPVKLVFAERVRALLANFISTALVFTLLNHILLANCELELPSFDAALRFGCQAICWPYSSHRQSQPICSERKPFRRARLVLHVLPAERVKAPSTNANPRHVVELIHEVAYDLWTTSPRVQDIMRQRINGSIVCEKKPTLFMSCSKEALFYVFRQRHPEIKISFWQFKKYLPWNHAKAHAEPHAHGRRYRCHHCKLKLQRGSRVLAVSSGKLTPIPEEKFEDKL